MKKVLFINLSNQKHSVKTLTELDKFIGGVGVGLKLLSDNIEKDPIIFSVGPLNGFFPYVSKTSIVFQLGGVVEDIYIGGSLSTRIRFSGIDSILITGKSKAPVFIDITDEVVSFRPADTDINSLGLPGKRAALKPINNKFFLDDYFLSPENFLEEKMFTKNIAGIVVTGTKNYEIKNIERYEELYNKILARESELTITKGTNPSCSGCPMGCEKSRIGELGGNVLVHSLVACSYAKNVYSNIGVVFSCLNVLGYDYTHEDVESLPVLVEKVLSELS